MNFEMRFQTPASHALETRVRNVSTIRVAGVLSMPTASKGIEEFSWTASGGERALS